MSWWNTNKDKIADLNSELEENLGGYGKPARRGFNDRAAKLRHDVRDNIKREQNTGEQLIKEEKEAIEKAKKYKPKTSKGGENLAEEVVNKSFWDRIFGK